MFFAITETDKEDIWCQKDHDWLPCEEPKPEFDWGAEGFWVISKGSGTIYWLAKTSNWTWVGIFDKGKSCYSSYNKEQIIEAFELCPPPEWAHLIE